MKNWPVIAVSVFLGAAAVVFLAGVAMAYIRECRAIRRFNDENDGDWHGIPTTRQKPPSFATDSDGDPLHPEQLSPIDGEN